MKSEKEILILDGIWGRVERFRKLQQSCQAVLGPCHLWTYDNSGNRDLWECARDLVQTISEAGRPVDLIAYSMGGLVVRAALTLQPDLPVQQVAFLNTPHYGSLAARALPLVACRQMRPGSAFLREIEAQPWSLPTLAVWTPGDLMVLPGSSARWEQADVHIRCDLPAHLWVIYSSGLHRQIIQFFRSGQV